MGHLDGHDVLGNRRRMSRDREEGEFAPDLLGLARFCLAMSAELAVAYSGLGLRRNMEMRNKGVGAMSVSLLKEVLWRSGPPGRA